MLLDLPRAERLAAIEAILKEARSRGLNGFSGECGSAAIAINRVLFDGLGVIAAGLNVTFEREGGKFIGHFAVRIDDEELGCCYIDIDGRPKTDVEIESWGMLDVTNIDYQHDARDYGFELTQSKADRTAIYEFDDDDEVLDGMPGSGIDDKITLLRAVMTELGFAPPPHPARVAAIALQP